MVQRLNKSLKSILTTAHTEKHGGHSVVIADVKKSKEKKVSCNCLTQRPLRETLLANEISF